MPNLPDEIRRQLAELKLGDSIDLYAPVRKHESRKLQGDVRGFSDTEIFLFITHENDQPLVEDEHFVACVGLKPDQRVVLRGHNAKHANIYPGAAVWTLQLKPKQLEKLDIREHSRDERDGILALLPEGFGGLLDSEDRLTIFAPVKNRFEEPQDVYRARLPKVEAFTPFFVALIEATTIDSIKSLVADKNKPWTPQGSMGEWGVTTATDWLKNYIKNQLSKEPQQRADR